MRYKDAKHIIQGYLEWSDTPDGRRCRSEFGLTTRPDSSDAADVRRVRHFLSWATMDLLRGVEAQGSSHHASLTTLRRSPVPPGTSCAYSLGGSMRAMARYLLVLREQYEQNDS